METKTAMSAEPGESRRETVGESAIIVPVNVPVAVNRLRERMDPSAADGVPAHVTLIYPFMPPSELKDDVRRRVEEIIAAEPAFPLVLASIARFPNVVYLEPDPTEPFRRLTRALAAAFPNYPPYEGVYDAVVPHLTVAADVPDDYLDAAAHALPPTLPIRDVVREAWLIGHTPELSWHTLWRLPLGTPRTAYPGS
ncbi:MAG TPA: 2'-5' RNA ligase family protein [Candidatus Limnocylindrales bacterium]